jgi:hypothetical protein
MPDGASGQKALEEANEFKWLIFQMYRLLA